MPSLEEHLTWLYDGTDTRRFHGRRMVVGQTVGEHSLRLILLLLLMQDQYGTGDGGGYYGVADLLALVRHAATHDLAEHMGIVGDIPSPAKHELGISEACDNLEMCMLRRHSGLVVEYLPAELEQRFKFVDCLDGMLTAVRERQLGNTTLGDMYWNYQHYLEQMPLIGIEQRMKLAVEILWEKANGTA